MAERAFLDLQEAVQDAFRPDFDGVERRAARRRTRTQMRLTVVAAGLAVALVTGAIAVARTPAGGPDPAATTSAVAPVPAPDFDHLRPASEVWPSAVRQLPKTLPDGTDYAIAAALGHDRYIVQAVAIRGTNGGIRGLGTVYLLDAAANRATRVSAVATAGTTYGNIAVDGDWVVWLARAPHATTAQLWTARLSAGNPVPVADNINASDSWGLAVVDGAVVWAQVVDKIPVLYRAPLAGGPATAVPGGSGFYMTTSGWAVEFHGQKLPNTIPLVWNLATGERRRLVLDPRAKHMTSCSAQWCVGTALDGGLAAQQRDGSGFVGSPNIGVLSVTGSAYGRFATGHIELTTVPDAERGTAYPGWRGVLWDLGSGSAGTIGGQYDGDGFWSPGADSGAVPLDLDSWFGRAHRILDLTTFAR